MNEALILDLYRHPTHLVSTKKWTYKGTSINSHCGDEVTLYLHIHDSVIKKATFQSTSCSMCLAASEFLCREIQGHSVKKLFAITVDSLLKRFEIEHDHKRMACVTLPFDALKEINRQLKEER